MSRTARVLVGAAVILLAAGSGAAAAPHQSSIGVAVDSLHADVVVGADGTTTVTERIVYDFGAAEGHGIFRDITTRFPYDDVKRGYDRVTPLTVESVHASPGASAEYKVSHSGSVTRIRIGDPDRTVTGIVTYTLRYQLRGVLNHFADHDELPLDIVGTGWEVPVSAVQATVTVPSRVLRVACYSGPVGSRLSCDHESFAGNTATFREAKLEPGEATTVVVGFPTGLVPTPRPILDQRWSLGTAFATRGNTIAPLAGELAAGGLLFGLLAYRVGRDRRFRGSAVDAAYGGTSGEERVGLLERDEVPVEFVPPKGLRPGQVGTLVHERARPVDVTATIVDLAARGHLRITEVPRDGAFGHPDWTLTRLGDPEDLKDYERTLFDGLFDAGDEVNLSDLRTHFAPTLRRAEGELVGDTVDQGWFRRRPDQVIRTWRALGVVVVVAGALLTALLAAKTSFGLLGLPVVLLGVLFVVFAGRFPYRTAKGHAVFLHCLGFKRFIDESEKDRARFAEQHDLFSEYLPYAIVFGDTDKWAKAFAGLDDEALAPSWYVGSGPFNLLLFTASINSFAVTTSGTLSAVAAPSGGGFASGGFSGFGGGFSGGGFGGGGGGGW